VSIIDTPPPWCTNNQKELTGAYTPLNHQLEVKASPIQRPGGASFPKPYNNNDTAKGEMLGIGSTEQFEGTHR
jgi:hypothetical protein